MLMAGALSVAITACGTVSEDDSDLTILKSTFANARASRTAEPPKPLVITQQLLDNTKEPVLLVFSEIADRPSLLRQIGVRQDATPGDVVIWRASDGAQVMLRDGVMISSRGVGGDLAQSDVTQVRAMLRSGTFGTATRSVSFISGDNKLLTLTLSCAVTDLGSEALTVVEIPENLRHIRETCTTEEGAIEYDYWVDPATQVIRKSRQWAGPVIGYFQITLLKG
jgi:hypothetical protein